MDSPLLERLLQRDAFAAIRLIENTDPHGMHMECKDAQGEVFARIAKVYKKGGLFGLFNQDSYVHGEVKDADGNLVLITTSYRGDTKRECKVEIHNPDGTLFGILYDAHWGADFELPDGTFVGKARRPVRPANEPASEPSEVIHVYTDASEQVVGNCDRHHPRRSQEERDVVWELMTGRVDTGMLLQTVTMADTADLALRTFLFLFPALQHLRFARSG